MISVLTEKDYSVTAWSGGTTKQLAIAPAGAIYADRDFAWRLSSATVDLPESDFTALPDYMRLIAPLRGEMRLWHNGVGPLELAALELHRFDGGDATHSVGKCVDYNLMLRKGLWDGTAQSVRLPVGESAELPALGMGGAEALFYCVSGEVALRVNDECVTLHAGETARTPDSPMQLTAAVDTDLMAAWVWPL